MMMIDHQCVSSGLFRVRRQARISSVTDTDCAPPNHKRGIRLNRHQIKSFKTIGNKVFLENCFYLTQFFEMSPVDSLLKILMRPLIHG